MKTAIITGITGQDCSCLAELLLNKGYVVYGVYRLAASTNFWRMAGATRREQSSEIRRHAVAQMEGTCGDVVALLIGRGLSLE